MIIASIDIGTNTVLLLIAQTDPKNNKIIPLLNKYRIPRIGKNVGSSGIISKESADRLLDVLSEYNKIAEDYGAGVILASATAAFRKSSNSKEIIKFIFENTGIGIEIIPGDREALYAYLGVVNGAEDDKKRLIIDIGGGSTEIIVGQKDNLLFTKSFNAGVVFSSEKLKMEKDLINHYQKVFAELEELQYQPDEGFAIAGTPTTIASIKLRHKEFNEEAVESYPLTTSDIDEFITAYSESQESYLREYNNILSGREDIIIPGSLILKTIMQLLGIKTVLVSTRGIRHGAVYYYLKNHG
jgi:exopolyphosphatase / guanosine-5'-triphosphate,3'-diphosphate pyrophosphatase